MGETSNRDKLQKWANNQEHGSFVKNPENPTLPNDEEDVYVYFEDLIQVEVTDGEVPSVYINTQWEEISLAEYGEIEADGEVLRYKGQLVSGELNPTVLDKE